MRKCYARYNDEYGSMGSGKLLSRNSAEFSEAELMSDRETEKLFVSNTKKVNIHDGL